MTERQKEEMQVSKLDNRSILGKIFTKIRKMRKKITQEHLISWEVEGKGRNKII